jgi:hypothetical protein
MAILRKEIHCQNDTDLVSYELYSKVSNTHNRQIILAVEPTFLQALAHPRLGYMTVTPLGMIWHLNETYSRLMPGEIETNRLALSVVRVDKEDNEC